MSELGVILKNLSSSQHDTTETIQRLLDCIRILSARLDAIERIIRQERGK